MNKNSKSSGGHSWDVPSSTGLDRDDCVILGYLPIDFDVATNGVLKEGSPVALPTELLDGMAKRWPKDYMTLLSALMHQSPENAWLGDKGKSLFLRWRIDYDWVGARIRFWQGHPGELAVYEIFPDASGGNPNSVWMSQLRNQGARPIAQGPFRRSGFTAIAGGDPVWSSGSGSLWLPPLGGLR